MAVGKKKKFSRVSISHVFFSERENGASPKMYFILKKKKKKEEEEEDKEEWMGERERWARGGYRRVVEGEFNVTAVENLSKGRGSLRALGRREEGAHRRLQG